MVSLLREGRGNVAAQAAGKWKRENWKRKPAPVLAFVAVGALLGIKPIWRDAEHIVALDADTVDDRAYDGARLHWLVQATRGRSDGFLRDALSGHGRILARRGLSPIVSGRHPWDTKDASVRGGR